MSDLRVDLRVWFDIYKTDVISIAAGFCTGLFFSWNENVVVSLLGGCTGGFLGFVGSRGSMRLK